MPSSRRTVLRERLSRRARAARDAYTTEVARGTMLGKFGSARARALEVVNDLADELLALTPEAFEPIFRVYHDPESDSDLRLEHGRLKAREAGFQGRKRVDSWHLMLDLASFRSKAREVVKSLMSLSGEHEAGGVKIAWLRTPPGAGRPFPRVLMDRLYISFRMNCCVPRKFTRSLCQPSRSASLRP
jgi:hypothetical protein